MIPSLNINPTLIGLIAGGAILLAGPWLLRKAGTALLLLIACALALDLWGWLTWSGRLSPTAGGQIAVFLVGVALALILARNRLVSWAAQIACSLALCAVAGSTLAGWLGWSEPLVWTAILLGTAIVPPAASALLATAIFCACAGGVTWYWTAVILAASVSISWTLACRGRRTFWDPALRAGSAGKIRLRRLAATAIILVVPALGWLCLDHVGSMRPAQQSQGQKVLVGRVCASLAPGEQLLFDDGTGVVELVWKGHPDSRPEAGMVIFLKADVARNNRDGVVLQGRRRIAVW